MEKVEHESTLDHFIPKSKAIQHAYRWRNYRLALMAMNRRKRDHEDVLDPFTLPEDTFRLNLMNGSISPNPGLETRDAGLYGKAVQTIARLGLDDENCRQVRRRYIMSYVENPTPATQTDLERRAPFVWREIVRQGAV